MANKFQNSILQRLEQEKKQAKPAAGKQEQPTPRPAAERTVQPVEDTEWKQDVDGSWLEIAPIRGHTDDLTEEEMLDMLEEHTGLKLGQRKRQAAKQEPMAGGGAATIQLDRFIHMEPVRQAKNKTFYLDVQVIEGVRAAAKQAGMADSRLVNNILRSVLGLEDDG